MRILRQPHACRQTRTHTHTHQHNAISGITLWLQGMVCMKCHNWKYGNIMQCQCVLPRSSVIDDSTIYMYIIWWHVYVAWLCLKVRHASGRGNFVILFLWILWIIMGTFHFLGIQTRLCEIVVQVDAIGIHVFTCYAAGLKYHLDRYRVFGTWLQAFESASISSKIDWNTLEHVGDCFLLRSKYLQLVFTMKEAQTGALTGWYY